MADHNIIASRPPNEDLCECTVCRGAEGSIPTDCPGRPMTSAEQDEVHAGRVDYRDGSWWVRL